MGITLQRAAATASFLAGLLHLWFWEFIRAVIYEKVWHMLSPYVTADGLLHYGLRVVKMAEEHDSSVSPGQQQRYKDHLSFMVQTIIEQVLDEAPPQSN